MHERWGGSGHLWQNRFFSCPLDRDRLWTALRYVDLNPVRLRSGEGREQPLGGCELFRRSEPLDAAVWDKLMLGLSARNYGQAAREFAAAYGIEKSAVSGHFIRVSRRKPRELLERPLDELSLRAIYIGGVEYHSQHLIVAPGLAADGRKTVLGLRQGAAGNAVAAGEPLGDLGRRGADFTLPRLCVLGGVKALRKAVKKHAGKAALIQRRRIHKRRNVVSRLPEEYRESADRKMANACQMASKTDARREPGKLCRELMELDPSAARSWQEGMEETWTIHEPGLSPPWHKTLAAANPMEPAFSIVERICSRVKCWRRGGHIERWVGSALWVAEKKFWRVKGYKDLPKLLGPLKKPRLETAACRAKAA